MERPLRQGDQRCLLGVILVITMRIVIETSLALAIATPASAQQGGPTETQLASVIFQSSKPDA